MNTGKKTLLENNLALSQKAEQAHTFIIQQLLFPEAAVQVHLEIHLRTFTAASFVITRTRNKSNARGWQDGEINCDIFIQWKTIHQRK